MGFENRSFENCPDERSLKRARRRSSERHSFMPIIEIYPFAQANRKRTPSVQNLMLRHFGRLSEQREILPRILKIAVRSSEPQANSKRAKPNVTTFWSLKRATRR